MDANMQAKKTLKCAMVIAGMIGALALSPVSLADAAKPKSGQQVYDSTCAMCHSSGAAGAPKFGDKAAWQARAAKGADVLKANALKGINVMPPKGTCMSCTDDEVKAAVDYMVSKSQ
ncbi:MAG: cytochrome c5 family protein [Gammaproteobacteria bacterium]|nr:cytochrome c5 family protein [Gammaproteobacteria bacterium]